MLKSKLNLCFLGCGTTGCNMSHAIWNHNLHVLWLPDLYCMHRGGLHLWSRDNEAKRLFVRSSNNNHFVGIEGKGFGYILCPGTEEFDTTYPVLFSIMVWFWVRAMHDSDNCMHTFKQLLLSIYGAQSCINWNKF